MRPEAPGALRVEEIASPAGLAALVPGWRGLWERHPGAAPFQHPDWLVPWWECFGEGELWTLAFRRGARLVGVAPLFLWSGAGVRQVTPVGNGISDRVDLLAERGAGAEVAAAVLAHLAASPGRWDTADFRDLPPDSALLRAPVPAGIEAVVEDDVPSPVLSFPDGAPELGGAVPAPFARKLRYYRRRLEREAEVAFERAAAPTLDAALDALVRLHRARWSARGEPGVLDAAAERFHRRVAPRLLERGMLRAYLLRLDGEPAGVYYGFLTGGRAWYYLGGFDPGRARWSVGSVLVAHAVEEAVREGAREVDFLRGQEPYKYAWGAVDHPARRLRLRRAPAPPSR